MKRMGILAAGLGGMLLAAAVIAAPGKPGTAATMPAAASHPEPEFTIGRVIPNPQNGRDWYFVAAHIDSEGKFLYLVGRSYTLIEDAKTGKEVARLANSWGNGLALVPEVGRGFISTGQWGLIVFDLKTHAELGRVSINRSGLGGMIYDPASKKLLIMQAGGDVLVPVSPDIDLKAGQPDKEIDFEGLVRDMVADGQGMVYVTVARSDKADEHVAVLDTRLMKIAATWPIPQSAGNASGISMDRLHSRLFIACNGRVLILSATDGHEIANLPAGKCPIGYAGTGTTAFSGGNVFASCGDGTLTVLRQDKDGAFQVQQTVAGADGVTAMAVNPLTGSLYVPTMDPRKTHSPPGFKILVVEKKQAGSRSD